MFLPVKADFPLTRFPVLTVLVCLICFGVFLKQESNWRAFEYAIAQYCDGSRSRIDQMVLRRAAAFKSATVCGQVMYGIHISNDPSAEIDEIAGALKPLSGLDNEDSREYFKQILNDELRLYRTYVPEDPDSSVAYNTATWNPWHMITASFAHGDWAHIIFNLIFFFAFATAVEVLVGPIVFIAFVLANSLIIGVTDSVVSTLMDNHHWTLGLSGVVMGMMGLFAYLLPRGKIRCYYWVIIIFGSIALPGWLLASWYIGGDILQLLLRENHGTTNVLAHVAGGVAGYFYGFFFLKKARETAVSLQRTIDKTAFRLGS